MSEPNQGTRIMCPKCHRAGTAKGTVLEGAKIRCPGCGHIYEFHEGYSLRDTGSPATATPPANPESPVHDSRASGPANIPRKSRRKFALPTLLKLPGWIAIATGVLQLAITVGGTTLGTLGSYWIAQRAYSAARLDLVQHAKTSKRGSNNSRQIASDCNRT